MEKDGGENIAAAGWRVLWAKSGQVPANAAGRDRPYHPLILHMLDVAAVAGLLWDEWLVNSVGRLEPSLGDEARALVMFVAGAHDIGKASPGFQYKVPELAKLAGLFLSENDVVRPHGFVGACILRESLGSNGASAVLSQIAGGHHGVFPRSMDLVMGRDTLGNQEWNAAREKLVAQLAQAVGFQGTKMPSEIQDPAVVPILAGLITVSDWIGSNQDFFPCQCNVAEAVELDAVEYWRQAQCRARRALECLGWLPAVKFAAQAEFSGVFPVLTPNHLQRIVSRLAAAQNSPYLMIVEAPMGHGKTEAAVYAADLAMCRGFARGTYVAMPTQATSNAMFKRVLDDYLKKRGHHGKLNLQLVHGDALLARLSDDVQEGEVPAFEPESIGDDGADVDAKSWFTARKRPLLAPFGVGTIDQSLLSVLQTKHWFVRLFGLSGKVVIFDEVHAYDSYMRTILERLLHWLAELDCTVILLSATLPDSKRKALAKAYSGRDGGEYKRYPRITLATPRHYPDKQVNEPPICAELPMDESRAVGLEFSSTDLQMLAMTLGRRLKHGGCAAVICNTVDRSIEVYKYLHDRLKDTECLLFHARTLRMWRRAREAEVLRRFGKGDGHRPTRAVLVATQVIEQSLDLDFDLMVSEIAPIDLLLQRIGRLHRHERQRPRGLDSPQFIVLCEAGREGTPPESFGKSIEYVYDRYILLRTWLAIRKRERIGMPSEIESLVERVYGDSGAEGIVAWEDELTEARNEMISKQVESEKSASRLLVSRPQDPSDLIEQFNDQLADDDDPEVHKTVRAATREGDPSISVVMLPVETDLTADPEVPEVRWLLDRSAQLSHKRVVQALLEHGDAPSEWARNAHLRHARLLRLDAQNQTRVNGAWLTLDEQLGIVIEKGEG